MYQIIFSNVKYIVMDCRPQVEYLRSSIKVDKCQSGNIPGDRIHSGLSAYAIGNFLEKESKTLWDTRNDVDMIILLDNSTSKSTFPVSKLAVVKDAIEKVSRVFFRIVTKKN